MLQDRAQFSSIDSQPVKERRLARYHSAAYT